MVPVMISQNIVRFNFSLNIYVGNKTIHNVLYFIFTGHFPNMVIIVSTFCDFVNRAQNLQILKTHLKNLLGKKVFGKSNLLGKYFLGNQIYRRNIFRENPFWKQCLPISENFSLIILHSVYFFKLSYQSNIEPIEISEVGSKNPPEWSCI